MEKIELYIKTIIKEKIEIKKSYEKIVENDRQFICILQLILEIFQKHNN